MKTIIVQSVQGKLRNARKEKQTVYLSGSLGMGKTTAVKYFYRNTPHIYLDGSNGKLLQMPGQEMLGDKVLIIDDISQIADIPSRQFILARVYDHKDQVVLIGRGKIPTWLAVADIDHSFLVIGNRDLEFTDENIRELYRSRYADLPTDPDEFAEIVERSFRNPLYLSYMIDNSGHSEDSISQIISEAEHSLFQYMEHKFYNQLRREVREALLQLAMIGKFTVSMAEIVTANQQICQILEEMKQLGNFLANADNDTFYIRHFYLNFLSWKESVVMSRRQRESVYERAALYYEMNENMERALFYYKKAEDNDEILHLLTKISEENPEMMNFTEIGPYLENLSVENIQSTPQLMCGMSMMYSLRMNPRKAEEWYEKLREYHLPAGTKIDAKTLQFTAYAGQNWTNRVASGNVSLGTTGDAYYTETVNEDQSTTLRIYLNSAAWGKVNYSTRFMLALSYETITDKPMDDYHELSVENTANWSIGEQMMGAASATATAVRAALTKEGNYVKGSGNQVTYTVNVNQAATQINGGKNITLWDALDPAMTLKAETIKVTDDAGNAVNGWTTGAHTDTENGSTRFTIAGLPDEKALTITYTVVIAGSIGDEVAVSNTAGLTGIMTAEAVANDTYKLEAAEGSAYGASGKVTIIKSDAEDLGNQLKNAEFSLYSVDLNSGMETFEAAKTTDDEGRLVFDKNADNSSLKLDTLYYFTETRAPEGYILATTKHYFILAGDQNDEVREKAQKLIDANVLISESTLYNIYNEREKTETEVTTEAATETEVTTEAPKETEAATEPATDFVPQVKGAVETETVPQVKEAVETETDSKKSTVAQSHSSHINVSTAPKTGDDSPLLLLILVLLSAASVVGCILLSKTRSKL